MIKKEILKRISGAYEFTTEAFLPLLCHLNIDQICEIDYEKLFSTGRYKYIKTAIKGNVIKPICNEESIIDNISPVLLSIIAEDSLSGLPTNVLSECKNNIIELESKLSEIEQLLISGGNMYLASLCALLKLRKNKLKILMSSNDVCMFITSYYISVQMGIFSQAYEYVNIYNTKNITYNFKIKDDAVIRLALSFCITNNNDILNAILSQKTIPIEALSIIASCECDKKVNKFIKKSVDKILYGDENIDYETLISLLNICIKINNTPFISLNIEVALMSDLACNEIPPNRSYKLINKLKKLGLVKYTLYKTLVKVIYMPENIGYLRAKEHFEALI